MVCNHSNTERGFLKELRARLESELGEEFTFVVSQTDRDPLSVFCFVCSTPDKKRICLLIRRVLGCFSIWLYNSHSSIATQHSSNQFDLQFITLTLLPIHPFLPPYRDSNKHPTIITSKPFTHVFCVSVLPLCPCPRPFPSLRPWPSSSFSWPRAWRLPPAPFPRRSDTTSSSPRSSAAGSTPSPAPAVPCAASCSVCSAARRLRIIAVILPYRGTCFPS